MSNSFREDAKRPIIDFYVGLDLGQANDHSAISIIELQRGYCGWDDRNNWTDFLFEPEEFKYNLTWLEQLPTGWSYPKQIRLVRDRFKSINPVGKGDTANGRAGIFFAVDFTGVGRACYDLLVEAGLSPTAITITGGNAVNQAPNGYNVPKKDLITNLQVLMQTQRLTVSEGLPDRITLEKEMAAYRHKISLKGHDTFDAWRESDHDDLVLSVACAAWLADYQYQHQFQQLGPGDPAYDTMMEWERTGYSGFF